VPQVKNLQLAFEVAEKHLGVASLLDPSDVAVDKPDERSIMTYVAALYHAFASMQSADVAGRRVANLVGEVADVSRMENEYEAMVTTLMDWIDKSIIRLDNRDFPPTVPAVRALQGKFKTYRTEEKPGRERERADIEAKYFDIQVPPLVKRAHRSPGARSDGIRVRVRRGQTKLRALSRPMYRPPEGYQIADINKAWVVLEQSESDHDAALVEEIKRLTRLEQVRASFPPGP
jgi:hypothetical protein